MFEQFLANHTFGVHLSRTLLRCAHISSNKHEPQIIQLSQFPVQEQEEQGVKRIYMSATHKLPAEIENWHIATGLLASDVLIRPLEVKLTKEKEIASVLPFQAEPILPFPPENGILDSIILSQKEGSTQLTLLAARKDRLHKLLEQYQTLGIDPETVSCVPVALAAFAQHYGNKGDTRAIFVLHIGERESVVILAKQGKLIGAYSFPFDVSRFGTPEGQDALRMEAMRCIYALAKQNRNQALTEVLVTGVWPNLAPFCTTLSETLKIPANPPRAPSGTSIQQMQEYAVPIGYALSVLPNAAQQVNFRQQDFVYPKPWKRIKQPLMLFAGACLLAALMLFFFTKAWVGYQEDNVRTEFVELLKTVDKPYPEFEKEFLKKTAGETDPDIAVRPIKELSQDELEARVSYLENEIQATPDIFPLQPNTPRVSDLLAWLGIHPQVVSKGEKSSNGKPIITLENLTYSMVKRPQQGKKQEKYQVKVELEFSAPTPKAAREFHDALMAPNDFVDPKQEIKWNAGKDRYRTSFYLKDRTAYLPSGGS
jgi:type IV pilus assembly protein PilM